jgi:hypothetical protein
LLTGYGIAPGAIDSIALRADGIKVSVVMRRPCVKFARQGSMIVRNGHKKSAVETDSAPIPAKAKGLIFPM